MATSLSDVLLLSPNFNLQNGSGDRCTCTVYNSSRQCLPAFAFFQKRSYLNLLGSYLQKRGVSANPSTTKLLDEALNPLDPGSLY